jgi:hypothetical protein
MSVLQDAFGAATSLASFNEPSPDGSLSSEKDFYVDLNERSSVEPLSYYVRENEVRHASSVEPESDPDRIFFVRQQRKKSCDNYAMNLADQGTRLHRDFLIVRRIVVDQWGGTQVWLGTIQFRDGCLVGTQHGGDYSSTLTFATGSVTTSCKYTPGMPVAVVSAGEWSSTV